MIAPRSIDENIHLAILCQHFLADGFNAALFQNIARQRDRLAAHGSNLIHGFLGLLGAQIQHGHFGPGLSQCHAHGAAQHARSAGDDCHFAFQ